VKGASNYEFRNFALSLPAFVLWPNMFGLLLTFAIFAGLHFGLPLLKKLEGRRGNEISLAEVCEVIEILLLGANAGLTHLESLKLVAETVTDPMQSEIAEVIARCNLGISLTRSLSYLTEKYPDLAATIKVISRSETTGGPIIEALELELLLIDT
jgi:Flp pilus assembly protein TadB